MTHIQWSINWVLYKEKRADWLAKVDFVKWQRNGNWDEQRKQSWVMDETKSSSAVESSTSKLSLSVGNLLVFICSVIYICCVSTEA